MKGKTILIGLLLIGVAMALDVNMDNAVQTIAPGEPAQFQVTITNPGAPEHVEIALVSDIPTSITDSDFILSTGESETISVFGLTNDLNLGLYLITMKVNDDNYQLVLNVQEGGPELYFKSTYSEVSVMQGEYQELKFYIRNDGPEKIRNIVIEGDILEQLNPEYPEPFNLNAGESEEIEITVTVPEDYPINEYEFSIKAGAGNLIVSDAFDLEVVERESLEERLDLKVLLPWESIKQEGNVIGYEITVRVTNLEISDINNIEMVFEGMPEQWTIDAEADEEIDLSGFTIEGYEERDITLEIIPNSDFSEHKINITLVKGDEIITKNPITLSGGKIGFTGGGLAIGGGSLTIGFLVVVVLVLVLLYMRQKNIQQEETEERKDKTYLEKLVDKTIIRNKKKK